ncbi:MAG TPA: hypothetical protein VGX03_40010 [Candidatus Binatia bacterium]|jgi:hypothetical protein|nr:hypothetical protein [Candidatus Binatia bacterium]
MAENTQAANPFLKMFENVNAPLCGPLKQAAAQWIDTSAEWAHKALEWNEKMTTWAKETPLAPLFETQRSLAAQVIENSTALARSWWRLEPKTEGKAA